MDTEIIITKSLTKSGDSTVLVIPKDIAEKFALTPGSIIEARIRKLN